MYVIVVMDAYPIHWVLEIGINRAGFIVTDMQIVVRIFIVYDKCTSVVETLQLHLVSVYFVKWDCKGLSLMMEESLSV